VSTILLILEHILVHEWTYDSAEYASFRKRLVKGQALFSAPPERENTGEDG
jgi:hypothetical protein